METRFIKRHLKYEPRSVAAIEYLISALREYFKINHAKRSMFNQRLRSRASRLLVVTQRVLSFIGS